MQDTFGNSLGRDFRDNAPESHMISRRRLVCIAVTSVLTACSSDKFEQPPFGEQAATVTSPDAAPDRVSIQVARARAKVGWIGRLHRIAMDDLVSNKSTLIPQSGTTNQRRCEAALRILEKYSPEIEARAEMTLTPLGRSQKLHSVLVMNPRCRGLYGSGQAASELTLLPAAMLLTQEEDTVTGAFEGYLDQISVAVDQSDGTPSNVTALVNSIVIQAAAAGIPAPDLEVVVAAAEVATSSAEGWTATQQAGGFPGCQPTGPCLVEPENAFRAIGVVAVLAASDVLGGALAAVVAHQTGTKKASQLVGAFGWGALGTSALTALAFM